MSQRIATIRPTIKTAQKRNIIAIIPIASQRGLWLTAGEMRPSPRAIVRTGRHEPVRTDLRHGQQRAVILAQHQAAILDGEHEPPAVLVPSGIRSHLVRCHLDVWRVGRARGRRIHRQKDVHCNVERLRRRRFAVGECHPREPVRRNHADDGGKPGHRSGGAGSVLLNAFESDAKKYGCHSVVIGCYENYKPEALKWFYEQSGYVPLTRSFEKILTEKD